ALGEESAEQAANFVHRLITEEAKEETCEVSPRTDADTEEMRMNVLASLDAEKIQIRLDNQGHLSPRFTRIGYVLWWPPAKRRKSGS
ncbi:MAG: hypothetical protein HY548_08295, partial [Elusimicrobia bacterium]|nr:hypothetical protein [Elusimicrobiota bacterium]